MSGVGSVALVTDCIKTVFEKYADRFENWFKGQWGSLKIDLGVAFDKYLKHSHNKYSTAKTLLYKDKPRRIRDFLVIPILRDGGANFIPVNTIHTITGISHFLLIRGTGGIGKSTLMKHLFLSTIEMKDHIPIFFELRDINDRQDDYNLTDLLFESLGVLGDVMTRSAIEYALSKGMFLFFLDGYDEITSSKAIAFLKK